MKNAFYFILKALFCSQDVYVFVLTLWSCRKKDFIRKIELISKFMASQPGYLTIAIHILHKISWVKGNETWSINRI